MSTRGRVRARSGLLPQDSAQAVRGSASDRRGLTYPSVVESCHACDRDWDFLRLTERPDYESGPSSLRIVDLFCGCGGLSLGIAEAAREIGLAVEIPLAVDTDADAISVFQTNFPMATVEKGPVESLFDGELGSALTEKELDVKKKVGRIDILAGGPPCQGHSDLNNHTRRRDPRNALYDRMSRAAEVLEPSVVLVENVPAVVRDAAGVVGVAEAALKKAGYRVVHKTINLGDLGVPQKRKRHLLVAAPLSKFDPKTVLENLAPSCPAHPTRSLRWAIDDLTASVDASSFDGASIPSPDNAARIQYLFDRDEYNLPNPERPKCHRNKKHTYLSMYGRLSWDEPAQTVTTGFGSMGQGRYVHPAERRTLTPHEAARLQTFPDFFDFTATTTRRAWARLIGNAVPPLLSRTVTALVLPHVVAAELATAA